MNVMTEEDARGKWCPFARCGSPSDPGWSHNRDCATSTSEPSKGAACLASGCMAWRWRREWRYTYSPCAPNQMRVMPHDKPPGNGWRSVMDEENPAEPYRNYDNDRKASLAMWERDYVGYCGLAGSPTP